MPAEVRTGQVGEVLWLRMVRSSRCRGLGGGQVVLTSLEVEVACQLGLGGSGLD